MSTNKKKVNTVPEKPEKSEKEIIFESLSSFYDKYISAGKLIVKSATLYGLQRVSYVKGKDFKQFFNDNFEEIQKEILSITKTNIGKEANKESLQSFYSVNQKHNIMHYLKRIPGDKAKYPKRLLPLRKDDDNNLDLIFSETGFYILLIKNEKTNKPLFYLALLIILVLFIVLFPIWPLNVKLGVLYFLLSIMIFLIVFLILTIVVAIVGALFGYDIFVCPNIDDPKLCWRDRILNPFVAIEKREDDWWVILIRIWLILSLIGLGVLGYFYPAIPRKCYDLIKSMTLYVYQYGKTKVEDFHYHRNAVTVKDRNPLYDDLDNL